MADQKPQAAAKPAAPPAPAKPTEAEAAKIKAENLKVRTDRFRDVAPKRTRGILKSIEVLGNCSNRSGYEFTQADIDKIFGAIQKKLDETKMLFKPKSEQAKDISFTL